MEHLAWSQHNADLRQVKTPQGSWRCAVSARSGLRLCPRSMRPAGGEAWRLVSDAPGYHVFIPSWCIAGAMKLAGIGR